MTNFYNAGIPYSDTFNEVRFQYKSDIPAGDTLVLFIIRFENGSSSAEIKEAVVGTNSNWTAGSVTVSNATQDSLFIQSIHIWPWQRECNQNHRCEYGIVCNRIVNDY
jgi:hypothetical protein